MHHCLVCGAPTEDPPWGEDGRTPLFEICPSCGCEFGYEDSSVAGINRLRAAWLASGGKWREPKFKPADLEIEAQIALIPSQLPIGVLRNG